MNEKIVMVSNGYDLIDGRNAYQSDIKSLTLGEPMLDENKKMQIAAQIWKTGKDGELFLAQELPIHQVFDLMIFLSRTLLYFKEASIILNKDAVTPDFFVLSTKIAGEILQKFINYQFKFAIVGDFSGYTSKPLKDFIYESNKGRDIFFVSSEEDAIEKLSRT